LSSCGSYFLVILNTWNNRHCRSCRSINCLIHYESM